MEGVAEEYPTSMNRYIMLCFIFGLLLSCNQQQQPKTSPYNQALADSIKSSVLMDSIKPTKDTVQSISKVIPDTTVNNMLFLEDYTSAKRFYPNIENTILIERVRSSPIVLFANNQENEYLMAYQYEGDTKNAFGCFEIGYRKDINDDISANKVRREHFETESGLKLGLPLNEVIARKGTGYTQNITNTEVVLMYRFNNFRESGFLKRYNMPGYFLEITLKDNKVSKILYGFDYP